MMRRLISRLPAIGLSCAALTGCAGFWDEVSSRDFSVKEVFYPPDAMMVLRTSSDGDARAKAFRRLEEPIRSGGNETAQNEVVKMLTDAAVGEPQPLCRMAAIQTLGRFQDSRATPALINAYESADKLSPDLAYMVRCQALNSLSETRHPTAANFLVEVARQSPKSDLGDRERGQARDVRLAAVRALRNFPNSPAVAETAAQLAQAEKDVAVRDRARESYAALTGHEPPSAAPLPPSTAPLQTVGHREPAPQQ